MDKKLETKFNIGHLEKEVLVELDNYNPVDLKALRYDHFKVRKAVATFVRFNAHKYSRNQLIDVVHKKFLYEDFCLAYPISDNEIKCYATKATISDTLFYKEEKQFLEENFKEGELLSLRDSYNEKFNAKVTLKVLSWYFVECLNKPLKDCYYTTSSNRNVIVVPYVLWISKYDKLYPDVINVCRYVDTVNPFHFYRDKFILITEKGLKISPKDEVIHIDNNLKNDSLNNLEILKLGGTKMVTKMFPKKYWSEKTSILVKAGVKNIQVKQFLEST